MDVMCKTDDSTRLAFYKIIVILLLCANVSPSGISGAIPTVSDSGIWSKFFFFFGNILEIPNNNTLPPLCGDFQDQVIIFSECCGLKFSGRKPQGMEERKLTRAHVCRGDTNYLADCVCQKKKASH